MSQEKPRTLSHRERILLTGLAEECAEVVQACTKLLRFGHQLCIPEGHAGAGLDNINHLGQELDQVRITAAVLQREGARWRALAPMPEALVCEGGLEARIERGVARSLRIEAGEE